jgi:hypothetical protein
MRTAFGTVVVCAWCVAVPFAQQQTAPAAPAEPAHKVYLLTGCLEVGAGAIATFKLTDASPIGRAPSGTTEAGAVGTSGEKLSYVLQPDSGLHGQGLDAEALKARAGQRVEVTVRPVEKLAEAPPPAGQTAKFEPAPERFTVTAIKRVTGTCSSSR